MIGTLDPGRQLKGSETITLTMALDEGFTDGVIEETAKIKDFADKCTTPGSIESLKASGECSVDKTTADYSFDVVIVSGQNKAQTYYYQFEGSDIEREIYVTVYVNGTKTAVDLKKGSFELSARARSNDPGDWDVGSGSSAEGIGDDHVDDGVGWTE